MLRFGLAILATIACVLLYAARDGIRNLLLPNATQQNLSTSDETKESPQIFAAGIVEGMQAPLALRFESTGKVDAVRVRSGDTVKAGALLAELEADSYRLKIARAEAQLHIASAERDHWLSGRRGMDVPTGQRRTSAGDHDLRPTTGSNASSVSIEGLEIAEAQVASAQAELSLEQLLLEKSRLVAPIDGTILTVGIQKGDLVGPSSEAASMSIVNRVKTRVRAFVEEFDALNVVTGTQATVIASGKADRPYHGVVLFCAPIVQPKSHRHSNPGERLDVRVREIIVELKDGTDLLTGLPVEVFVEPKSPAGTTEHFSKGLSHATSAGKQRESH